MAFLYEMTVPYYLKAEREGRDPEAHEVWFESDVEFHKGEQIEYGDRLLYISNRRPVFYPSRVGPRGTDAQNPTWQPISHIKLFCMNV